jgi:hypothetical protein
MAERLRLGFCEGEATVAGLGFQGARGVDFIGADVPLACGPRRGRGGTGSGRTLSPSWVRCGEDGGPDGRGPCVGEKGGKESAERAGPRDGPAREGKWAGLGEKKKRFCIFLKRFKHFQFKFKHNDSNLN